MTVSTETAVVIAVLLLAMMSKRRVPTFASSVQDARTVYARLATWINRYHGGLPTGFLAAIIAHESGGDFSAPGDPSLGEVGYLQVAAYVPPLFGYAPEARNDPESNIAIGVLEYELEAVLWHLAFPQIALGSDDNWKLARLAFAIGRRGSHYLATLAAPTAATVELYPAIVDYVRRTGGVSLGSQSAQKVFDRVVDIERQWLIGKAIGGTSGPPVRIPEPPVGSYTLPADVSPYFSRSA